ncbi:hypothetical protein [Sphingosinicella terrae]|uniref:hypothetical protein n=1 Tax=Sphingosinicella terrae TaxID=2172047 RepID=UPI000E0D73A3|nr:hypothetical protein [Sphingosinicella terrae]
MDRSENALERRRKARGCAFLLLVFVVTPLFLLKMCQWADAHPTDQEMVEEFRRNRDAFAELLAMVREEPHVTRVARDFIRVGDRQDVPYEERSRYLPDERYAHYLTLFDRLRLEAGVQRNRDGSVGFLRSTSGLVTSGSSKEFVWAEAIGLPVLAPDDGRSLEEACSPRSGCQAARRIAPQWYIAFESH